MARFSLPAERDFGWDLKPTSSSHFNIGRRPNGQLNVVLNHSLVRGCTTEMLHWWFKNFANLRIVLDDTPGYEGKRVPAYWLWHPQDHYSARYIGKTAPDGTLQAGAGIHVQEVIHAARYGMRFPVDNALKVPYFDRDGMTLNKRVPILGNVLFLRSHFRDVTDGGEVVGVHYHYEVVAGPSGSGLLSRLALKKLASKFDDAFFEAWHTHNTVEVGTWENFLPALWAQRDTPDDMHYATRMNPDLPSPSTQSGFARDIFEERVAGYAACDDAFDYQAATAPSFLTQGPR